MGPSRRRDVRNVGLTPPYFHNGVYGNLRQAVEFYARGGSKRDKSIIESGLTPGTPQARDPWARAPCPSVPPPDFGTNVDFFIRDIKSTDGRGHDRPDSPWLPSC